MCRICLIRNVRLYKVANKNLQIIYEKLTETPFETEDTRPVLACISCYGKLKQCHQLLRKCQKAVVFSKMLSKDYPHIKEEFDGVNKTTKDQSINPVCQIEMSVVKEELPDWEKRDGVCQIESVYIKEELPDTENIDVIDVKEEYLCDEIKVENIPLLHSESDSEDELSLMDIKTKVEKQEVPEEDIRPSVTEKPKPKDTVTNKLKKNVISDSTIIYGSKSITESKNPIISNTIINAKVNNSDLNAENVIVNNINISTNICPRNNSNKDYLLCKILNDKGIDTNDINKHLSFNKPYKCDICQRSFSLETSLNDHIKIHTGDNNKKADNQKSFSENYNLTALTQTSDKPHKCDICQRSYSLKGNLHRHSRMHAEDKLYKCNICHKSFTHLNKHIRIHDNERQYKCDICQRSFAQEYNLKIHVRTHTGEKPYKCDICQRSFSSTSNLNRHIPIHSSDKPFKCDVCQRRFNLKSNLRKHTRIHTGEKPYKCDVCQRSFSCKSTLNNHSRIHTGKKPFKCDICQRSFNQQNNLKVHIRTHGGEKPYNCDICHRSFSQKVNLKSHIRRHASEKHGVSN